MFKVTLFPSLLPVRTRVALPSSHTLTLHRGYYSNTYTFRPGTYNISPRRRELIYAVFIYLADTHESLSLTVIHSRYTAATTITRIHSVPGLIIEARADTTHIRRALIHSRRTQVALPSSHTLTLHRGYYSNTYTFRPGTYNISPRRRELIYAIRIYLTDIYTTCSIYYSNVLIGNSFEYNKNELLDYLRSVCRARSQDLVYGVGSSLPGTRFQVGTTGKYWLGTWQCLASASVKSDFVYANSKARERISELTPCRQPPPSARPSRDRRPSSSSTAAAQQQHNSSTAAAQQQPCSHYQHQHQEVNCRRQRMPLLHAGRIPNPKIRRRI
ncbi:unnamed protein product, partial [Trichogramma brassicae]